MFTVSRHLPRILTGLCLLVILGSALWYSGPYFYGVLLLFSLLGLWEFYGMFWPGYEALGDRLLGLALGGGLLTVAWLCPARLFVGLGVATLLLATWFLFRWANDNTYRFSRVAVVASGVLYVPMLLIPALSFSLVEQVFLICVAVCSDTAAYFLGIYFGTRPIWAKVSPKKTLEGSLGGLLVCVLVCTTYGVLLGHATVEAFLLASLALGIVSQIGDFFESALKRSRSVKDSGSVLPGHGGVLDRVDSLLFIIPTYAAIRSFWVLF